MSEATTKAIDEEVRAIVDRNYDRAKSILDENLDKLHLMSETLIKYETIDKGMIDDILAGNEPRPPKDWGEDSSEPPSGNSVDAKSPKQDKGDGKIGDPAGQH